MASIKVYKQTGAEAGTINLDDSVFGVEFNEALVHQVVVAQLNNARQGTKSTLTTKGHRTRASGLDKIASVDGRRSSVRAQAPRLLSEDQ